MIRKCASFFYFLMRTKSKNHATPDPWRWSIQGALTQSPLTRLLSNQEAPSSSCPITRCSSLAKEHTVLSLTLPLRTIVIRGKQWYCCIIVIRGKQWYCFVCSFNIRLRDLVVLLYFLSCDFKINTFFTTVCICKNKPGYGNCTCCMCGISDFYLA